MRLTASHYACHVQRVHRRSAVTHTHTHHEQMWCQSSWPIIPAGGPVQAQHGVRVSLRSSHPSLIKPVHLDQVTGHQGFNLEPTS